MENVSMKTSCCESCCITKFCKQKNECNFPWRGFYKSFSSKFFLNFNHSCWKTIILNRKLIQIAIALKIA